MIYNIDDSAFKELIKILKGYNSPDITAQTTNKPLGLNAQVNHPNGMAIGKNNLSKDDYLFMVGCGSSSTDRKNAFTVTGSGALVFGREAVLTSEITADNTKACTGSLLGGYNN